MFWQWLVVGIIALAATLYLVRATWRTWFATKGSCGGSCSCAASADSAAQAGKGVTMIPVDQLRLRSAERPPPG